MTALVIPLARALAVVPRSPVPCANHCGETSETTSLHSQTGLCARCLVERLRRALVRVTALATKDVPGLHVDCLLLDELLLIEASRALAGDASASALARGW